MSTEQQHDALMSTYMCMQSVAAFTTPNLIIHQFLSLRRTSFTTFRNGLLVCFELEVESMVAKMLACTCRDVRTSQGTFIARHEDKAGVLAWIEDKLALLTGLPATHGEV